MLMISTNRQQRLKDAFGDRQNFCFYAYLRFIQNINDIDEVQKIVAERKVELDEGGRFILPKIRFGSHVFSGGYGRIVGDRAHIQIRDIYPLYCVSSYKVEDNHSEFGTPANDLSLIAGQYVDSLENHFSGYQFERALYCENNKSGVDFKYALGEYDPSLFHLSELETLKAVSFSDGKTIHPKNSQLSLKNLEVNRHADYKWYWIRPKIL